MTGHGLGLIARGVSRLRDGSRRKLKPNSIRQSRYENGRPRYRAARPDLSLRDGPRNATPDRLATKTVIVAHHMDDNSAQDVFGA